MQTIFNFEFRFNKNNENKREIEVCKLTKKGEKLLFSCVCYDKIVILYAIIFFIQFTIFKYEAFFLFDGISLSKYFACSSY